ncbi:hypothetical protein HK405_010825, partial [Cladochytrium tenue]
GLIFLALNLPAAFALRSRAEREPLISGKKLFNWALFKDVRFTLLLVGYAIALFPLFVPPFFLPSYATNIGLSTSTSSLILAVVFFWTPGEFLGSPIAGYLLQAYGGASAGVSAYRPAIFYSGALSLASAACFLAVRLSQGSVLFKKI